MNLHAETEALSAAMAIYRPGDPIGRWGPVAAQQGRSAAEPCAAGRTLCDDTDIDAWMTEAKSWSSYAKSFREDRVVPRLGPSTEAWPPAARIAELAYMRARDLLGGSLGAVAASIVNLADVQRHAKHALELWSLSLEGRATPRSLTTEPPKPGEVFHSEVAALAKLAVEYSELSPAAFEAKKWEALFLANAALNGATEEGRAATRAELYQRWEAEWTKEGGLVGLLGPVNPKWLYKTSDGKPPVIRLALDSALHNPSRTLVARVQLLQSIPPERREEFTDLVRVLYGDVAEFAGAANFEFIQRMKEISKAQYHDEAWFDRPWLMLLPEGGRPAPIEILLAHQVGKRADEEPTPEEVALQMRQGVWASAVKNWDVTFLRDNPFSQLYRGVADTAGAVVGGAGGAAKNLATLLAWAPYILLGAGALSLVTLTVATLRK